MKRICVFSGSCSGARGSYREAARQLGEVLVRQKIELVYGGANVGLMGELANTVLKNGGRVTGVIPNMLVDKEVAHKGLTELKVVSSMHERKLLMADLSDAFIALPGGFGTFEEFFEVVTWTQLGVHSKPCGVLNIDGYYDPLLTLVAHATREGFIREGHAGIISSAIEPEKLLQFLSNWKPIQLGKWWVNKTET